MAATSVHGKGAKITWPNGGAFGDPLSKWSANISYDFDAVPLAGTAVAMSKVAGLKDWTATVEGAADDTGPALVEGTGATLTLNLTQTAGDGYLTGPAICSGVGVVQDPGGAGKITYNFQGNGEITWAIV
jgi:hypothetical protein